ANPQCGPWWVHYPKRGVHTMFLKHIRHIPTIFLSATSVVGVSCEPEAPKPVQVDTSIAKLPVSLNPEKTPSASDLLIASDLVCFQVGEEKSVFLTVLNLCGYLWMAVYCDDKSLCAIYYSIVSSPAVEQVCHPVFVFFEVEKFT